MYVSHTFATSWTSFCKHIVTYRKINYFSSLSNIACCHYDDFQQNYLHAQLSSFPANLSANLLLSSKIISSFFVIANFIFKIELSNFQQSPLGGMTMCLFSSCNNIILLIFSRTSWIVIPEISIFTTAPKFYFKRNVLIYE